MASGLSAVTLVSPALALPAGIVAARWLGPDRYGRAQAVLFLFLLASLVRTGVFEGGVRAYVHAVAVGNHEGARRAQNVAVTLETVVSAVPGLLLLTGALFVDDSIRRRGLLLAPLAVVATSFSSYLSGLYVARERFSTVARASLVRAVLAPGLMVLGIPVIGAVAVIAAPVVADLAVIAVLVAARPRLGLRVEFDATLARPLIRTGLPLGLAAIVYWAYRLVGSGSIALTQPPVEYGIYAFAAIPVTVLARGISTLHTVLMPAVWGEMADARRAESWGRPAARATILLVVTAGALTSVCHAGFGPVVHLLTPRFGASVPVLEVLAFNILLLSVAAVPSLVLDSVMVNRQVRHLGIWAAALLANVAANAVVLAGGKGVLAVAVNDIWIQAAVVVAVFAAARPHLPTDWPGRSVLRWALGCTALTTALLVSVRSILPEPDDVGALLVSLAARGLLVGVAWAGVGIAFYRWSRIPIADRP